jgi:soluble lytic murein transglycosylase
MTILRCLERIIRDHWFKAASLCVLALLVPVLRTAQVAEPLARAFREKSTPGTRAPLEALAKAGAKTVEGALARLALAQTDLEQGRAEAALAGFNAVSTLLPNIRDHIEYGTARALIALNRKSEALEHLQAVARHAPVSPQRPWAILMSGTILLEQGNPAAVVEMFRSIVGTLPAPPGPFHYGRALKQTGSLAAAAVQLQKVFYDYPNSPEANQAGTLLEEIQQAMGADFPPPTTASRLSRVSSLARSNYTAAISELNEMIPYLAGSDRDLARIRIGVVYYLANRNQQALDYLKTSNSSFPEPDAERLYYIFAAARRLLKMDDGEAALTELSGKYPNSSWRTEALTSYGNHFLLENDITRYEPLYKSCYEMPSAPDRASYCHWKVAWVHWMRRDQYAVPMMLDHAQRFPESEKASAALYYLARDAESRRDFSFARTVYEEVVSRFPNYFYAVVSRERLLDRNVAMAQPSAQAREFLSRIPKKKTTPPDFNADAATLARIARAKLLSSAALDALAETELRFAVRNDAKNGPVAIEMARIATDRNEPDDAMRYIKSITPGYLGWNLDDVPREYWRYAFPLPFRDSIERHSRAQSLDSLMVAALIRQESEFDPKALSRAKAMGLTQVMPQTGRELSRVLRIRPYFTAMLYQPDTNLKMGTYYIRDMLNRFGGKWEAALAAYNAGKSRADTWLTWGEFREPAEFSETIPFTETRDYVQSILRNADIYRRLYGGRTAAVSSGSGGNSHQTIRSTQ